MAGETDSRERIMDATYDALVECGYADLTMSGIAAKSETSTSLLHYHFDTKEDLLVAFLDHLLEQLEADLAELTAAGPIDGLYGLLEWFVIGDEEPEREAFLIAFLELRAQAPYNSRYRERMRHADRLIRSALEALVGEGIDAGLVVDNDPETIATLLLSAMDGGRSRGVATGTRGYTGEVRDALVEHVLADIFTDEARSQWAHLATEAAQ